MSEPLNSPADIARENFEEKLKQYEHANERYKCWLSQFESMKRILDHAYNEHLKSEDLMLNAWKMYNSYAVYDCENCGCKYQPHRHNQKKCSMCEALKLAEYTNVIEELKENNQND
jgi:hypothetical protein